MRAKGSALPALFACAREKPCGIALAVGSVQAGLQLTGPYISAPEVAKSGLRPYSAADASMGVARNQAGLTGL
jgi:hypothetical protein